MDTHICLFALLITGVSDSDEGSSPAPAAAIIFECLPIRHTRLSYIAQEL